MSSFEFYVPEAYVSCQYDAEQFFIVPDNIKGYFPLLKRAQKSFEALNDDLFSFDNGEAMELRDEVVKILELLELDLDSKSNGYSLFCFIAEQLQAVFEASEKNKQDIKFRWG